MAAAAATLGVYPMPQNQIPQNAQENAQENVQASRNRNSKWQRVVVQAGGFSSKAKESADLVKLCKYVFKWLVHLGVPKERLDSTITLLDNAGKATSITRIPVHIKDMATGATTRDVIYGGLNLQNAACLLSSCFGGLMGVSSKAIKTFDGVASIADMGTSAIDMQKGVERITDQIKKQREQDPVGRNRSIVKENKRLGMLEVVKAIVSITATSLSFAALVTGVAVVPAMLLLAINTTAVSLSIFKYFYKENMTENAPPLQPQMMRA